MSEIDRLRLQVADLQARLDDAEYRIEVMTALAPARTIDVPGKGEVRAAKRLRRLYGLLQNREGKIVSRDALFAALCEDKQKCDEPEIKIIDVYIHHIRKLIEGGSVRIETVWGVGYRLIRVAT